MEHYICDGGCKGESETPGTCQVATCPKHGLPLKACGCTDGKHHGAWVEPVEDKYQI